MKNKHLEASLFILLLLLVSAACSRKPSKQQLEKQIAKNEHILKADFSHPHPQNSQTKREKALSNAYQRYIRYFPKDSKTPSYMFQLAMLDAATFHKYNNCISLLKRLNKNYSDKKLSEKSLFFIGYTYAEKLKNYPLAKASFKKFLKKYPKSHLVPSVKFELKYMGKPATDVFLATQHSNHHK